jgi:superfamily II DNA/RNA helicase
MEINDVVKNILSNLGIEQLNPMQDAAFKSIQEESEVLLLAPTGSGKTLAFLLPVLFQLKADIPTVQCLILSPSRELAIQIESVWKKMGTGFKINACYGGHSMATEIQNLSSPPAVLVGTPGRIFDHLMRRTFEVDTIQTLVLDEFDKSLAMGFHDQMSFIMERLGRLNKKILVSATSRTKIPEFTGIERPRVVNFTKDEELEPSTDRLSLKMVVSESKDKADRLVELLSFVGAEQTLIFCNHRDATERAFEILQDAGIESSAFFHGGMDQLDREKTLIKFRNGTVTYLVASDLAARGLDIPDVRHVIHYHLPLKHEDFVHRNGRTARQAADGTAYLLMHRNEQLPDYINEDPELLDFSMALPLPPVSEWQTVYISGGKKDKLSKIDIVGCFIQKGKLTKEDVGKIELMDFMAFVAVKKDKVMDMLHLVRQEKIKGKKYKIELTR